MTMPPKNPIRLISSAMTPACHGENGVIHHSSRTEHGCARAAAEEPLQAFGFDIKHDHSGHRKRPRSELGERRRYVPAIGHNVRSQRQWGGPLRRVTGLPSTSGDLE